MTLEGHFQRGGSGKSQRAPGQSECVGVCAGVCVELVTHGSHPSGAFLFHHAPRISDLKNSQWARKHYKHQNFLQEIPSSSSRIYYILYFVSSQFGMGQT